MPPIYKDKQLLLMEDYFKIMDTLSLSHNEILAMLPHRYPFLFVDKVIELIPGVKGKGIKNVTLNESFFIGHFPTEPIMPGVLIIEACGQLAGLVQLAQVNEQNYKNRIEYLASVQKFNFKGKVHPGDQLILEAWGFRKFNQLIQANVNAFVEKNLVAEGRIILTST